ncbi:MAG: hypothetical protein EXR21_10370 [Flavobacteriaceae bacterium]|nr:hypothetical protein [Flavobacteriaceae bacterium]
MDIFTELEQTFPVANHTPGMPREAAKPLYATRVKVKYDPKKDRVMQEWLERNSSERFFGPDGSMSGGPSMGGLSSGAGGTGSGNVDTRTAEQKKADRDAFNAQLKKQNDARNAASASKQKEALARKAEQEASKKKSEAEFLAKKAMEDRNNAAAQAAAKKAKEESDAAEAAAKKKQDEADAAKEYARQQAAAAAGKNVGAAPETGANDVQATAEFIAAAKAAEAKRLLDIANAKAAKDKADAATKLAWEQTVAKAKAEEAKKLKELEDAKSKGDAEAEKKALDELNDLKQLTEEVIAERPIPPTTERPIPPTTERPIPPTTEAATHNNKQRNILVGLGLLAITLVVLKWKKVI